MKKRWYVNWLVVITVLLFVSAFTLFFVSLQGSLGLMKCAYGDAVVEDGNNCVCDQKGNVVCDDSNQLKSVKSEEFTTENLSFTYDFLNLVESERSLPKEVKFVDISQVGNRLRVVLEKNTYCNADNYVAPQVGFYKIEDGRLTFTIATNLVDSSFNIPCVSESIFDIDNMPVKFADDYALVYQDQYGSIIPSGSCSYEGFLRNDEDVYNSADGCYICVCSLGQNVCEKEPRCLK